MRQVRFCDAVVTGVLLMVVLVQVASLLNYGASGSIAVASDERPSLLTHAPVAKRPSKIDMPTAADSRPSHSSKVEPTLPATTVRDWLFDRASGYNPPHCNVQPNLTDIDPYKGCPLPGLNNLLFTQVNRWYCALRDNRALHLRDRTCNKGSSEPFRFSTIMQVDYPRLHQSLPGRPTSAICWSDISKQDVAPHCEWADIPKSYGTDLWWSARRLIDFHAVYYATARRFVELVFQSEPYLAVHLRRGDYWQHCVVIKRKGIPPWVSFKNTNKLFDFERGCYPTLELVEATIMKVAAEHSIQHVFIATNTPDEFSEMAHRMATVNNTKVQVAIPKSFFDSVDGGRRRMRKLDTLIVEMAVLALGNAFLFNRYSSLSGMAYEMAVIHSKATPTSPNVMCW
jgi:hypothetical protein